MYKRQMPIPKNTFFLFGPRATGKTTWLDQNLSRAKRIDLLSSKEQLAFLRDPSLIASIAASCKKGDWIVVDEIQKVPAILDEIHLLLHLSLIHI